MGRLKGCPRPRKMRCLLFAYEPYSLSLSLSLVLLAKSTLLTTLLLSKRRRVRGLSHELEYLTVGDEQLSVDIPPIVG